jgi:hypothetical protein
LPQQCGTTGSKKKKKGAEKQKNRKVKAPVDDGATQVV